MDELEISGKKYISSKRAAELTGYAKDYVGQLARGGRIAATRVGRAWYVGKDDIVTLAGREPHEPIGVAGSSEPSGPIQTSETGIRPLEGRTKGVSVSLKLLQSGIQKVPETWGPVTYFEEEAPTLPTLLEKIVPELTNENIVIRRKPISESINLNRFTESQKSASIDGMMVKKIAVNVRMQPVQTEQKSQTEVPTPFIDKHKATPTPAVSVPQIHRRARSSSFLVPAVGVSVLILGIIWVSGSVMGAEWMAGEDGLAASITADGAQSALQAFIPIVMSFLEPVKWLISTIVGSFWTFFSSGFLFIKHLLNLG